MAPETTNVKKARPFIMGIQERKKKEKERRRQQIIVAAKRVFSSKGFNKTTMEDIAREAELSPGTLYIYFKNKEDLYASLSLRILQFMIIRLEHLESEGDPQDKLKALKDVLLDVYDFDAPALINMFHLQSSETLKNISPEVIDEISDLSRRALGKIADIFETGSEREVFIRQHPVALADILWGMFCGVVLWESSKMSLDERKNHLKTTLDLAFEVFERGVLHDHPA